MDVLGLRCPTATIFLLLVIFFPIEILSADRPVWTKSEWETELKNFRQKFYPDIKGGAEGPIPELVECVINTPKEEIVCGVHNCPETFRIPCSNFRRQLILNEILLRKQYKTFDEDCDSHGTTEDVAFLDPPNPNENGGKEYIVWQNKLIDSGLKFCDPFKLLRCSPLKKCSCFKDLAWVKADDPRDGIRMRNTCAATDGNECHEFQSTYYKALSSISLQERVEDSIPNAVCTVGICSGVVRIFKLNTCLYDATKVRSMNVDRYYSRRQITNALKLGDRCNIQTHNQLVMYTKEEVDSFEVRLQNLEDLKDRDPEPKFCAPGNFFTCGASSKCLCKSPTHTGLRPNYCEFPPEIPEFNICDTTFDPVKEYFKNNETIPEWVLASLTFDFDRRVDLGICPGKQTCFVETKEIKSCACPDRMTGGVKCDVPLTKFLVRERPSTFPMDVANKEEKLKIFLEFNKKAKDLENILSMFEHGPCDFPSNLRAEALVARIHRLEKPGTKMNRMDYENLTNSIAEFIKAENITDATLCDLADGLTCQFESRQCVRESLRDSLSNLFQTVVGFSRLECLEKGCSPTPKMIDYDEIFDRKDPKGHIRPGRRANDLYVQETEKLLNLSNAKVKLRYCHLYKLDGGPFDPSRFIERCNSSGICSLCSLKPDPPEEVTEKMENMGSPDEEMTKKMEEENNQKIMIMNMDMNSTSIAHYNLPNQLQIISTFTTLLITNLY